MKKTIENQISYSQTRMAQEVMQMQFKFQNLCVKAEPVSLLGVEVQSCGSILKIEQCADVVIPEWNKFQMFIKNPDDIEAVSKAVLTEHPEFIKSMEAAVGYEGQKEPENTLIFTMPEVTKERREYLMMKVAEYYQKTDTRLMKLKKSTLTSMMVALMATPDEVKEASEALDVASDTIKANMDKARADKEKEIEDAYQKYLAEHPENTQTGVEEEEEEDISQSMEITGMPGIPSAPGMPEMPAMPEVPSWKE